MKVFLSWSGTHSESVAKAFRSWLPYVINAAEPWMSAADIEAGARWSKGIAAELESTQIGVLFITSANVDAPWLLFEAGALAKTLDETFVCPYLIGLKPSELPAGPLTQFQAKIADEDGTKQLVLTLNRALKANALPEDHVVKAYDRWWPDFHEALEGIPNVGEPQRKKRGLEEMIEEVLGIARRLDREVGRTKQHEKLKSALTDLLPVNSLSEAQDALVRRLPAAMLRQPDAMEIADCLVEIGEERRKLVAESGDEQVD